MLIVCPLLSTLPPTIRGQHDKAQDVYDRALKIRLEKVGRMSHATGTFLWKI